MKNSDMTIKVTFLADSQVGHYLSQFPGKTRAAVLSMIVTEYVNHGGMFGICHPRPPEKTLAMEDGIEEKVLSGLLKTSEQKPNLKSMMAEFDD
jgi:hypothetical protein